MTINKDYWNKFYSGADSKLLIPSQFGAFIAMEYLGKLQTVIDIGCGNGRDSIFFGSLGFNVVGIDASKNAIEQIKKNIAFNTKFLVGDISDKNLKDKLKKIISISGIKLIYSRFFLHAITENQELDFWSLINKISKKGDCMALEFRTEKDKKLTKSTPDHYRRFVSTSKVISKALNIGYTCEYQVEGFGYAKYKNDDAYVSRLLLKKK